MTALEYLTAIRFDGADAGEFLHNQLSSDVLALSEGESVFACYCEPKGRVLALMLVCRVDEGYYIIMSRALAAKVAARLKMYVMRSKVNIDVLDESTVASLPDADGAAPVSDTGITVPVPGSGDSLRILGSGKAVDTDTFSSNEWKALELEQGICWLGPETSAQFLPQMLGFDELGAVNFRKGCYPGQEIVARTRYLGKVKRHPRLLSVVADVCPAPLEKIRIMGGEEEYDAVTVECVKTGEGRVSLFVVTRMDPDLSAERIGFQGQLIPLD